MENISRTLNLLIAAVWLTNGLWCKVLNQVPRHRQIVARILGDSYARELTLTIGLLEILMAIWVVSLIRSRLCAIVQMLLVGVMNMIEFTIAPDLLLFGRTNALFASFLIMVIFLHEFYFSRKYKPIRPGNA